MTRLEDLLREAASRGLVHLSLHTVWSADQKTVYWAARATPSTGHSYIQVHGKDPVEIVSEVLRALPKAPKRKGASDPNLYAPEQPELDVTATVKDDAEGQGGGITHGEAGDEWERFKR